MGEEGLEIFKNFFGVEVLHWSLGLSGNEDVGVVAEPAVVRHRRVGLEAGWDCNRGVDGLEKNPNFELIRGLLAAAEERWF